MAPSPLHTVTNAPRDVLPPRLQRNFSRHSLWRSRRGSVTDREESPKGVSDARTSVTSTNADSGMSCQSPDGLIGTSRAAYPAPTIDR